MRVLVVAQYYIPEPVPKPNEIAEELTRRGHSVTVITGLPNYPSGKLAPGYRLVPWLREVINGVPVLRVFEVPYHGRSAAGRIVNYLSFTLAAGFGAFAVPLPDVIYVFLPPPTLGLSLSFVGALRGAPIVCDIQDIWPDEAVMSGLMREGFVTSVLRWIERLAYGRAAHLLVVTDGARENLLAKGVAPDKVSVLSHWYPVTLGNLKQRSPELLAAAREELRAGDKFIVTFAGNLGIVQGLATVLDAAKLLRSRGDIAFRFIGDGLDRARLEHLARESQLENVLFLGQRPSGAMPPLLAASDALLVHAAAGPLNQLLLPTKTLAYLAAGRPLIAAMDGATAELVREAGAGVTTAPGDSDALAGAIERLAAMPRAELAAMGERGRLFVAGRFDRGRIIDRLEAILAENVRN
jgi:glycosyltransferase involved in cell wall biosynthesis